MALTLTPQSLRKAFPNARQDYIDAFVNGAAELERAGILANAKRIRHFLAQGAAETSGFTITTESGNYSAAQLLKVFPKYFKSAAEAKAYARRPQAIFNRTYGGRLGNNMPGDGYKYRGRGIFQITGKDGYRRYGQRIGLDLVKNPDLAALPENSIKLAILYWSDLNLNAWADKDDILAVSRGINGGSPTRNIQPNGFAHRKTWLATIAKTMTFGGKASEAPKAPIGQLQEGDSGPEVRKLQSALRGKGYPVGAVDGIYGANTRRAVIAFQAEHSLKGASGIWQADYWPVLDSAEHIQEARQETTEQDLQSDPAVKRLSLMERIISFLGLGWLFGGAAMDQASSFPELIMQWQPVLEVLKPAIQFMAVNGWLIGLALLFVLWLIVRSLMRYIVRAYRNFDYQGGAE